MTRCALAMSGAFGGSLIGLTLAWLAFDNPAWLVVGNYGGAALGAWFGGRQ